MFHKTKGREGVQKAKGPETEFAVDDGIYPTSTLWGPKTRPGR